METFDLVLGAPSAGGSNVARLPDGRVAFVRHGAEGERVRAVLTEARARFVRADVLEVLEASPHRVEPPCPHAGPGACGGCDYQHLELGYQREVKARLLAEQLGHLARLELDLEVRAAPRAGAGNRTRVRFAVDDQGRTAMRASRSHGLVEVDQCMLAVPAITALGLPARAWPPGAEIEAVALEGSPAPSLVVDADDNDELGEVPGLASTQRTTVHGLGFEVDPEGFWQVHRDAPEVLTDAVLAGLALEAGDAVLDLYCGAGLFTAAVARAVGTAGSVVGIEGARRSVTMARRNLAPYPWASVELAKVDPSSVARHGQHSTAAVLDPPRAGAGAKVLTALDELPQLERLVSVSCDAATFARDLGILLGLGWTLEGLAAFDLFEFTEHAEQVAVLTR